MTTTIHWALALAVSLAGSAGLVRQSAAGPYVITGVSADAAPQGAPVVTRTATSGNLGGGFIEMLVTGVDPTPRGRVIYNRPEPQADMRREPAYAPAPGLQAMAVPSAAMAVTHTPGPEFQRQDVAYDGPERPGTIIVDTPHKFLFLVTAPGRALRYGIGVGRPGFTWAGVKTITRKAEWPDWTPPAEMLKRRPDLPVHMAGGPENPLGARAMYLGSTLYRIHGTNEPDTIGTNVSSGCIRMMNADVQDLYERVRVGTKVIVM